MTSSRLDMEQVEGRNPVLEAIRGRRRVHRILVAKGARGDAIDKIIAEAAKCGIPIEWVSKEVLDRLSRSRRHQGVVAKVDPYSYVDVDDMIKRARQAGEAPLLLACAGIEDPQNLGALIRTADAGGVHGVIIPRHRSAQLSATVARASAGAVEHIPVARVTNLSRTIQYLQTCGLWAVATMPDAGLSYFDADLTVPLVVVVGSEGSGIPRLIREHCDFAVSIPMKGRVNSLNVSVAAALLVYEALRQRQRSESVPS